MTTWLSVMHHLNDTEHWDHRMDVAAWLRDLGLERYVSAFRDNDIDAEVLLRLTAEDLISIGVTSVGHRRRLLDAIAGRANAEFW
jgi:hypothetical protein